MAGLRYPATILTLGSGSGFLLFLLNLCLPSRNARNIPQATRGHEDSAAVAILNPRKQSLFQHRITIDVQAGNLKRELDNDEILARFAQGFFGGWIFSPERWFFHVTGISVTNLVGFDKVGLEKSRIQEVWGLSTLSEKSPPPPGSLLFGNFLLAEKVSSEMGRRREELLVPGPFPGPVSDKPQDFASAEFVAGGSKSFELISSHRFEITRERHQNGIERNSLVTVTFSHVSCNSVTGRPYSTVFRWLHLAYARLLFADGIRAIVEAK